MSEQTTTLIVTVKHDEDVSIDSLVFEIEGSGALGADAEIQVEIR
jgi:hypothetical protein